MQLTIALSAPWLEGQGRECISPINDQNINTDEGRPSSQKSILVSCHVLTYTLKAYGEFPECGYIPNVISPIIPSLSKTAFWEDYGNLSTLIL